MLRPLPAEVLLFARALAAVPSSERPALALKVLQEASHADAFRRAQGLAHPAFGDGSLCARLMRLPFPPSLYADDPEFLHALRIVARAVLKHTAAQPNYDAAVGRLATVCVKKDAAHGGPQTQSSIS
jgi:hypothetical protein